MIFMSLISPTTISPEPSKRYKTKYMFINNNLFKLHTHFQNFPTSVRYNMDHFESNHLDSVTSCDIVTGGGELTIVMPNAMHTSLIGWSLS